MVKRHVELIPVATPRGSVLSGRQSKFTNAADHPLNEFGHSLGGRILTSGRRSRSDDRVTAL